MIVEVEFNTANYIPAVIVVCCTGMALTGILPQKHVTEGPAMQHLNCHVLSCNVSANLSGFVPVMEAFAGVEMLGTAICSFSLNHFGPFMGMDD